MGCCDNRGLCTATRLVGRDTLLHRPPIQRGPSAVQNGPAACGGVGCPSSRWQHVHWPEEIDRLRGGLQDWVRPQLPLLLRALLPDFALPHAADASCGTHSTLRGQFLSGELSTKGALLIGRNEYTLVVQSPTGEIVWNMTFAESVVPLPVQSLSPDLGGEGASSTTAFCHTPACIHLSCVGQPMPRWEAQYERPFTV